MTVTSDPALRCSAWTRAQSVDPTGSAGEYRGFVLLEVPLPWPHDIGEIPEMAAVAAAVAGGDLRLQALVPADPSQPRRVVVHRPEAGAQEGWFSRYQRVEADAGPDPAATVAYLLQSRSPEGAPGADRWDLLVCTHGRRDVCCGSQGTELAGELSVPGRLAPGVRLWRTSHTGGHRFAPTFLLLPQGTMWAYADAPLVDQVLERSVPFAEVAGRYRGCAGLGPAPVQALERAVLERTGWDLLDASRRGFPTGETAADGSGRYRLEAAWAAWEATIGPGRTLPVPECMHPLSDARKTSTEWVVSDLQEL